MPYPTVILPPSLTLAPGTSQPPQPEGDEGDTDFEGNAGWGRS
jgi:hypothetical protein